MAPGTDEARIPNEKKPSGRGSRWKLWALLLLIAGVVWGTGHVGLREFIIRSSSMGPTLIPGDHIMVRTFSPVTREDIRREELVVFRAPILNHPLYVKRVIGLPGDLLRIAKGHVYVNGKRLPEPYALRDPAAGNPLSDNFPPANRQHLNPAVLPQWRAELAHDVNARGELVVPKNDYFVIGDNFDHSWDSRYWGFVHRDAILGRPVMIYWSYSRAGVNWRRLFTIL